MQVQNSCQKSLFLNPNYIKSSNIIISELQEHNLMIQPRKQSFSSKPQPKQDKQQKKQKSSMMKKILIKNKIVSILSHQPRKLMKLAKMRNIVYKNLQQHTLLPKLTLTNLFPQIQDLNKKNQQHLINFQQVNNELTCSMISFQHKFSLVDQEDEGKILNLQTQKCYSHIPKEYFRQLEENHVQRLLTRNRNQVEEKAFDLVDYQDQIQYNINQQVGYKMKLFMDFAQFLQALAGLVDISCKKIQNSRARSGIVRQIIVQKSINIKILRVKQNNLTALIKIVQQLKKVKHMQRSLMSFIHAKGKTSINELYQKYVQEHEKIKEFCCRKNLCNFGDIKYYVEKNYQESFGKALQDYLAEMTKIEKQKFIDILKPSKAIYVSTPFDTKNPPKVGEKAIFSLDQSMDFEEEFQLTVKTNIEKEITNIFSFGLEKCTYSTDNLCMYIKQQLNDLQLNVYAVILENIERPKQDMLDNFVNFALNRPTQNSLQLNINDKILNNCQKSEIINKITLVKFIQVIELLSKKLMDLTIRCFSVVNQLLKVLRPLENDEPEKQQIVSAYLIELVIISIGFTNSCLGSLINLREIKQTEIQLSDKLIGFCEEWQDFLDEAETKYHAVWRKLTFNLSDQSLSKSFKPLNKKDAKNSFSQLQDFVKLNYKSSIIDDLDESKNQDVSQELISKSQVKLKLLNQIMHAKNEKLNFNFYSLTKTIINKNIMKVVENQTWTAITIMSSKIENSVGFLLYGQRYLSRLQSQNDSRNFLSKSLLLEKSNFGFKRKSEEVIPPSEDDMRIQTSEKYVKIEERHFRLVGVSEYILQVVYLLFLYFEKYSIQSDLERQSKNEKENMPEKSINPPKIRLTLLIEKTIQIVNILVSRIKYFVNNLKQLQKKVKSFAKFLLLTWVQLDFFKTIILTITDEQSNRFPTQCRDQKTQKQLQEMRKSFTKDIDQCMNEITKKYNSIGYQKIKQSIKKIELNPKKQIKNPSQTTSQVLNYFSKSLDIIKQNIIDSKQFWKFLHCPWVKIYLEKINEQYSQVKKVIMKSNGSNSGRRIEEIEWEDKLNWKMKELKWLLSAIENQGYTEHLRDLHVIEEEVKRLNEKNQQK